MMITHVSPDNVVSYFEMKIADLEKEIINAKVKMADATLDYELGSSSIIDNSKWEIYYMEIAIEYRTKNKLK